MDRGHKVIKHKITSSRKYPKTEQTDQSALSLWSEEEQFGLSQFPFNIHRDYKELTSSRIRDEVMNILQSPLLSFYQTLTLSKLTSWRCPAPGSCWYQKKLNDLWLTGLWQQHPTGGYGSFSHAQLGHCPLTSHFLCRRRRRQIFGWVRELMLSKPNLQQKPCFVGSKSMSGSVWDKVIPPGQPQTGLMSCLQR